MRKNKRRTVKPKSSGSVFNIYHPDFADKIQEAFRVNGTTYYCFKKDTEIRTGRYMFVTNFLQEVFFRMDRERLLAYINRIISEIDNSKGTVNIGNAIVFLTQMKELASLAFEGDTVYRLASVVYFDETEDLRTWDKHYNDKKIAGWKEDGTLDFFTRPFQELIGLNAISKTDIRASLDAVARLKDVYSTVLNSAPQQQ